jgi:hypothetical protein
MADAFDVRQFRQLEAAAAPRRHIHQRHHAFAAGELE